MPSMAAMPNNATKPMAEDTLNGVPVWVIDGMPHPGYKPKSSLAGYFTKIKGRCWIAKDSPHIVKIEPIAGAVLGKIVVLIAVVLVIQKRPQGLFAVR